MRTLARVLLPAGLLSLAAACGGGGESHAPVGAVNGPLVTTTSKTTINVVASTSDSALTYQVPLTFGPRAPGVGIYMTSTSVGLVKATIPAHPETNPQVTLVFEAPATLGAGTYPGQISLYVCAGDGTVSCNILTGYRLDLTVNLIVTPPPLTPVSQVTLTHDVIDAKYSRALDSIVMVSASPSNALYIYNTRTHVEVSQALSKVPTAVTVGPTGTDAAVGHDGLITYMNLAALTQAAPPPADGARRFGGGLRSRAGWLRLRARHSAVQSMGANSFRAYCH